MTFVKTIIKKISKFEVGDHERMSKCWNIFAKVYTPNWTEEVLLIKKVKNTVLWAYVKEDLNGEEIFGRFYEEELQNKNQTDFRVEKVI